MKTKIEKQNLKLPIFFKPLFWGYIFNTINPIDDKKLVIVNTLNYGNLKHWKWLVRLYGKTNIKNAVMLIPKSEFRKHVIPLIKLLFGVNEFKYVSRGAKIKAERVI